MEIGRRNEKLPPQKSGERTQNVSQIQLYSPVTLVCNLLK